MDNQKQVILDYLEQAYSRARMMDDIETQCRLSRAIIAFSYDNFEEEPNWNKMIEGYINN